MDVREKQPSEKRLIDREALLSFERMDAELCSSCGEHHTAEDVIMMIKTAPTIDAVPVTRCKDCKYMIQWADVRYCTVWDGVNGMGDDGFCNYGERKGGGSND